MEAGLENADLRPDDLKLLGVQEVQPRLEHVAEEAFLVLVGGKAAALAIGPELPAEHANVAGRDVGRRHLFHVVAVQVQPIGPGRQDVPLDAALAFFRENTAAGGFFAAAGRDDPHHPRFDDRVGLDLGRVDDRQDEVPALGFHLALDAFLPRLC